MAAFGAGRALPSVSLFMHVYFAHVRKRLGGLLFGSGLPCLMVHIRPPRCLWCSGEPPSPLTTGLNQVLSVKQSYFTESSLSSEWFVREKIPFLPLHYWRAKKSSHCARPSPAVFSPMYKMNQKMQWAHVLCRSIFVLCWASQRMRTPRPLHLTHLMDGLRASDGASETRNPRTQQSLRTTAWIKCAHRVQFVTC